jgi:acyl carrier protein
MTATSVEQDVVKLVAEQRGLAPQKVALNSRLLHDLGMDGDDAVEFFEEFEKRYGADLAPLYRHWHRHFGPEGCGSPTSLLVMLLLLFAPLLLMPFGISPLWVWGAEIAALLLWLWPLRQWPLKDKTIAVTVQDLVLAAETKRWPINYID